ncbi:MAG: hypothetical protein ABSE63_06230 [Thermoguttaceae bacterium]
MRAFAAILARIGRLAIPLAVCRCGEEVGWAEEVISESAGEYMAFWQKIAAEPTLWQGRPAPQWPMKPDFRRENQPG